MWELTLGHTMICILRSVTGAPLGTQYNCDARRTSCTCEDKASIQLLKVALQSNSHLRTAIRIDVPEVIANLDTICNCRPLGRRTIHKSSDKAYTACLHKTLRCRIANYSRGRTSAFCLSSSRLRNACKYQRRNWRIPVDRARTRVASYQECNHLDKRLHRFLRKQKRM